MRSANNSTATISYLLKIWIVSNCLLYLLSPSTTAFHLRVLGVFLLALLFAPLIGVRPQKVHFEVSHEGITGGRVFALLSVQLLCAEYALRFYTGSGIGSILSDFWSGVNIYAAYQQYFKEEGVAEFTLTKVPAILALASVKFLFLYCYSYVFVSAAGRATKRLLLLSAIPVLLIGVGRGTFFEVFEVLMVVLYGWSLRAGKFRIRHFVLVGSIGIIFLALFISNTIRRYPDVEAYFSSSCATSMYCFDYFGIDFYLEYVFYLLSTYFSMGIFLVSNYVSILFGGEVLWSILPLVSMAGFGVYEGGLEKYLCSAYVDCKAVWMPELITWIAFFGFLLVFPFAWLIVAIVPRVELYLMRRSSVFSFPVLYLIFLYMISIPVGKFWSVSSQNILCTIAFVGLLCVSGVKKYLMFTAVDGKS